MSKQVDEKQRNKLWDLVEAGDVKGVAKFFRGMDETARRGFFAVHEEFSNSVKHRYEKEGNRLLGRDGKETKVNTDSFIGASSAVGYATGPKSWVADGWYRVFFEDGAYVEILIDRNPPWLSELIEECLENSTGRPQAGWWQLARRFQKAGLIGKPKSDGFVLGMIEAVNSATGRDGPSMTDYLLENDDLVDDIWRLFEVEGGGETSLANIDKYGGKGSWQLALKELSEKKVLDRDRLLDESLRTLARDFSQYRVGWFSRFHEFLAPTAEERVERTEAYINLLGSHIPPTVSFALKALDKIQKAKKLDAQPFLASVAPALVATQKGTVKLALRILGQFTKQAKHRDDALRAMLPALQHESADVQEACLSLLDKHGVPKGVTLAEYAEHIAAPLMKKFEALFGEAIPKPAPAAVDDVESVSNAAALPPNLAKLAGVPEVLGAMNEARPVPALAINPAAVPRLDPAKALKPIENLDELIECASGVLEDVENPDEIERMLDGITRLCDQRPGDFTKRTGQLLKRAGQKTGQHLGQVHDMALIILAWLGADLPEQGLRRGGWSELFQPRLSAIMARLKRGKPFQLLSTPTHEGGWLDARVLSIRLQATDDWDEIDVEVALPRLAPEQRTEALKTLKAAKSVYIDAVRYALGAKPCAKPEPSGIWLAACAARSFGNGCPDLAEKATKKLQPGFESLNAAVRVSVRKSNGYTFYDASIDHHWTGLKGDFHAIRLVDALDGERNYEWIPDLAQVRWASTHFPGALDGVFATGAELMANNIDWWGANWGNRAVLEPMLNPDCRLTPIAMQLLAIGLGCKEPGEHGLATDILIRAVEDGRIDGELLGTAMGSLLFTGLIKPPRWGKTLTDAARVSALHGQVIRVAIEQSLVSAGDSAFPKGMHELLELWHQLAVESGTAVEDDSVRELLSGVKGSNKTAKAAKALVSLVADESSEHATLAAHASLTGRVRRAKRWATCVSA